MGLLEGHVALVTGGSRGIGRAIALRLASEGADLAICARNVESAERVAAEIEGLGRRCLVRQADVANAEQAGELIATSVEELGRLDVLVNNAGEQHPDDEIADITDHQLRRTFQTNMFSMFYNVDIWTLQKISPNYRQFWDMFQKDCYRIYQ